MLGLLSEGFLFISASKCIAITKTIKQVNCRFYLIKHGIITKMMKCCEVLPWSVNEALTLRYQLIGVTTVVRSPTILNGQKIQLAD